MYGVGQSTPPRRGIRVILGVMFLALVLVGLFYAFYVLVLKRDATTPAVTEEATATAQQAASIATETLPPTASSATFTPSTLILPTSTTRPTVAPLTDTPQPTPTLRPPPDVITTGVRASVNISEGLALNLRDLPTLTGSTVITRLVAGTQVDVVDGPEDVGDLRWWNVNGGEGKAGWVVETFGGETWLVPIAWSAQLPPFASAEVVNTPTPTPTVAPEVTPTAAGTLTPTVSAELTPTATLPVSPTATPEGGIPSPTVGGRARVTTKYQFINLRAAPGLAGETIGQLADGTIVEILEGPQELENIVWWKVEDAQGNVGWAAERVGQEVLLVPIQ